MSDTTKTYKYSGEKVELTWDESLCIHVEECTRAKGTPGVRYRVALCRCGDSKNKPFCDGARVNAGFKAD